MPQSWFGGEWHKTKLHFVFEKIENLHLAERIRTIQDKQTSRPKLAVTCVDIGLPDLDRLSEEDKNNSR